MDVPLRVSIQQREYGLRVKAGAEAHARGLADRLDERVSAFRRAFPMQTELTAVVMTSLALSEELSQAHEEIQNLRRQLDQVDGLLSVTDERFARALDAAAEALERAVWPPDDLPGEDEASLLDATEAAPDAERGDAEAAPDEDAA